jgi:hypothetical protein
MLSLNDLLVQNLQQVLTSLQYVLINFLRMPTRHIIMPKIYYNHNVFDSHFLQLGQKFLTTAFLIAIVIALHNTILRHARVKTFLAGLRVVVVHILPAEPVSNNICLGVPDFLPSCYKIHDHINVHLVADSSGKGLVSDLLMMNLFTKADGVNHTFHLV